MDGPMSRVPFMSSEFIATALAKSSRWSSSCTKIDWRVGISNALQMPAKSASPAMSGSVIRCSPESTASTTDCSAISESTRIRSLRRLTRSPSTPAKGARNRFGALARKPMRPVNHVEPDRRYAIHMNATDWIHVPIIETVWPT